MAFYAVELFFDASFEEKVRKVWKDFAESGISEHMHCIEHLRPHVSLNAFSAELLDEQVIECFHQFCLPEESFSLAFEMIGTFFPVTGTVFLAPKASEHLLAVHRAYFESFEKQDKLESNPYYLPAKWDAHCTLAIRVPLEKIGQAVDYCVRELKESMAGRVVSVGLVKISSDEVGVTSSPTIAEIRLAR